MRNEIRKYFVIRNFVMGVCTNNTQPMLQVFRKSVNLDEKKKTTTTNSQFRSV